MRLLRFALPPDAGPSLGLLPDGEERVADLTSAGADAGGRGCPLPWLRRLRAEPEEAAAALRQALRLAPRVATLTELEAEQALLPPVAAPEVWAAGVTYERSRDARDRETAVGSAGQTPYDRVYVAARPELFLKATGPRVRASGQTIGLRGDSRWLVPEPELALILDADGSVLGYTLGDDVSSRDIEGENPLYLPQAKIFRGACALGPAVLPACAAPADGFRLRCRVLRGGTEVWCEETHTARMRRTFADLVAYLCRHNWVPAGTALLTGTGLVPPDEFTLEADDLVEIDSPSIGVLRNRAVRV